MFKLLCFVLLLAIVRAVPYDDCGSKSGEIKEINVEGCTNTPCVLKRGSKVQLEVKFVSKVNSGKLTTKVYGVIGGFKVPWSGLPADACTGTTCPLVAGETYVYKNNIDVLASYPPISVDVQFEFKASSGENVMCFKLPVSLQ